MFYELRQTEEFRKQFDKLPPEIKQRFEKQIKKVKKNPFGMGKSLKGYSWFRELKNKCFRLYYIIFEKEVIILFVGVSTKKNQQKVIKLISEKIEEFKELVKNRK